MIFVKFYFCPILSQILQNNKYIANPWFLPTFQKFLNVRFLCFCGLLPTPFTSYKILKNAVFKPFLQYQISLKHTPIHRITQRPTYYLLLTNIGGVFYILATLLIWNKGRSSSKKTIELIHRIEPIKIVFNPIFLTTQATNLTQNTHISIPSSIILKPHKIAIYHPNTILSKSI